MAHNAAHLVRLVNSKAEFDSQLKEAGSKLVIVDFFAQWCGPCKTIAPAIEKLAETLTDVVFLKVDVDQVDELASEYGISCMPTFVAILEGKRVGDTSGANIDKITALINKNKPHQ